MSKRILEKAERLVASGNVVHLAGDFYAVIGGSGQTREVDLLKLRCTCRTSGDCSHVEAARIYRARGGRA